MYGAKYFAVTGSKGANARSGPGPQFQQLNHYPAGCTSSGQLSASAPGAVLVAYSAVTLSMSSPKYASVTGNNASPSFPAQLPPSELAANVRGTGQVLVGAVICFAINVPVISSLHTEKVSIRNSRIIRVEPDTQVPSSFATHLAEFACNTAQVNS